ncbi:MAG: hypothetical protein H7A03_11540, partial [Pseudomonadales bacterium]|nr:hypothetical protein [Pseudomonadales bacterium]
FVATVVGGFLGFSVILLFEGFQAQLWAWGLLASLVIGGIATVCLALLITRSAFTWRTGKVSSAAMIAMLSVGAVCLSSTILFGIQTKQTFVQDEVTHTKVVPVSLPKNLEGIKYADSENATLSYDSRGSAVRAEVKYMVLKGFSEPKIDVKRDGDRLTFSASRNNNEPCISSWILGYSGCINPFAQVTVYGPVDWVNYGNDTPDIDPVHIPEHLEN